MLKLLSIYFSWLSFLGGLGLLINERIGWRDYHGLGMVLLALFVVVFIIEKTSQYLRRKLS